MLTNQDAIYALVHDRVHALGGFISAAPGVGQLKIVELARYKSAQKLKITSLLKRSLGPQCIYDLLRVHSFRVSLGV